MTRCLEPRSRTLETEGKRRSESTFLARGANDLGICLRYLAIFSAPI